MEKINEVRQYLSFKLDSEVYAIDVSQVREILEFIKITKIPKTPKFMRGVINLRGSVVPVIDLRVKFLMSETQKTVDTCIVVIDIVSEEDTLVLGVLADSVSEVFELDPEYIEDAPQIGLGLDAEFIKGIGKYNDQFIMILDIDKIFTQTELSAVISKKVKEENKK